MSPRNARPYRRAPSGKRGDRTGHKGPRKRSLSRPKAGAPRLEVDPAASPPVVAIVGRPNVGKSTLLNAFARSLVSIVEPTPGVTRDRVSVLVTMAGRTVELVDTGGLGIVDTQGLAPYVEAQIDAAVARAALILFVVDAKEGVTPLDRAVAERVRKTTAPVILLANKAESERVGWSLGEMPVLGYGDALPISAQEGKNLERVERLVGERLPPGPTTPPRIPPPLLSLAFVGRVNAGKSSLVNALVHEERMIVSEVPGTTRDSVDVRFERDGEAFVVIDTAGMRKEKAVSGGLDFYAKRRSERALRRADVTALVLDATTDVSRLDREIAGLASKEKRPIVLVVNKWDLAPTGLTTEKFVKYLGQTLENVAFAPVVFTSAIEGKNVGKILDVAKALRRQATTRAPTAQVNKAVERAYALRRPRPHSGKLGKVYYGTQAEIDPPTIVLFVDDPSRFDDPYRRYLENRFREMLPFPEVPIRISFRTRERSPSKNPAAHGA